MKKIKLWLVRRYIKLLPTDELRDEIFKRAMQDWYTDAVKSMLGLFTQEYPTSPFGESRVKLKKPTQGDGKIGGAK